MSSTSHAHPEKLIMSLTTDNISQGEITVESKPQGILSIPTRQFTGRSAYSYEVKRAKNKDGAEVSTVREVPESSLEQWLFGQLSILANRLMNANRYKTVCVDEKTGEVSEPVWDTLDAQTLTQRLVEAVPEGVILEDWEWGTWKRRNPNAVGRTHLHEMSQRIATARRSTWDAEYLDKVRARASRNGKKSKRPKDVTVFQVLGFPFVDHSTPEAKKIIAAALGKTTRTVERRLKDYREAPSVWVPTSGSRYLSQPAEKAPTSPVRYLSRGDALMALPYDERPRAEKTEPVDWSYLLEEPEVTEPMAEHIIKPLDQRTAVEIEESLWAIAKQGREDWERRAYGPKDIEADLRAFADELLPSLAP